MNNSTDEYAFLNWVSDVNYSLMMWMDGYYWTALATMFFIAFLIRMAPLKSHHEYPFYQLIFIVIRKAILWSGFILLTLPFITLYLYDVSTSNQLANSQQAWLSWFITLSKTHWPMVLFASLCGFLIRFSFQRYALPAWSGVLKKLRNQQSNDSPTDIREELSRFKAKDFLPHKKYKKNKILIGLDEANRPIHVPVETWHETNMQVIGPTRYGKGVIMGTIMDQIIKRDECLFYIDPKDDKFAPHIMYQACQEQGRKFYYLTLHDEGIGKYAPFCGGSKRDALARLSVAFGLEFSGDPGTDYYKSQELKLLEKAFNQSQHIEALKNLLEETDANRIKAELSRWSAIKSLCPKKGSGFSIEKALLENAVVYVQGSLSDSVVNMATKVFISELIQEARRLRDERKSHLTVAIDEVSFLVSKILAQSLATSVGFDVNFMLAYQSQNDLLNIDDKTINTRYVHQSINVNSQIKAVYGGADFDTAEWAANLSGTVVKQVTKMEKTDISSTGGETWENQRMVGSQEENHINTNVVLSLPPRVCIFVQPRHLASICFSSFVPVKDMTVLKNYLKKKSQQYITPKSEGIATKEKNDSAPAIESTQQTIENVPEEFSNNPMMGFESGQQTQKESSNISTSQNLSHAKKNKEEVFEKTPLPPKSKPSSSNPVDQRSTENKSEDTTNNTAAKNRARKERQKAKKRAMSTANEEATPSETIGVSHAKITEPSTAQNLIDFESLESDEDVMNLLTDAEES